MTHDIFVVDPVYVRWSCMLYLCYLWDLMLYLWDLVLYGDIFVLYDDIFVLYMLLQHSMVFPVHFLRFSESIEPKWKKNRKNWARLCRRCHRQHRPAAVPNGRVCADGDTVGTASPRFTPFQMDCSPVWSRSGKKLVISVGTVGSLWTVMERRSGPHGWYADGHHPAVGVALCPQ
jgi:hypothetical protein